MFENVRHIHKQFNKAYIVGVFVNKVDSLTVDIFNQTYDV